jgi:hypothetical protein
MAVIDWSSTGIRVPSMIHGPAGTVGVESKCVGEYRLQVVNDPVHRRLAGVEQRGQGVAGRVGAQMRQHERQPGSVSAR